MAPTDKSKLKRPPSEKQPKASVARYLKSVEPQIHEGAKAALLLKGTRCSERMGTLLKDLKAMQAPAVKLLTKKNDIHPFEDASSVEFLMTKNDCATFALASHNKKRPDNLVLGRTFDGALLDCVEFGVGSYRSLQDYKGALKKRVGSKPMFLFTGDAFENDEEHRKLRNLILDFFRGDPVKELSLAGLDHVISVTAMSGKLYLRTYHMRLKKNPSGDKTPLPLLTSCGPDMDLTVRRRQFAPPDLWKQSMKQPRELKVKKVKNQKTNMFGETIGRLHLEKQDISERSGKSIRAIRVADQREKAEEAALTEKDLAAENGEDMEEFKKRSGFDEESGDVVREQPKKRARKARRGPNV
ncbi:hypothetical protein TeGR_g3676 [Tetraparma gracilis]|uniref:Ribosome production factor 2 homolog n=1 Tax=Tetraparma gracilis TaxID=2962635 RepID=A0ABQ6M5N8_9STRA|nr:hypothetical protein TeGR_g3676 [Tetraparma gracilis]